MDTCVGYDKLKEWDHRHLWHPFTQMQEWLAEDPLVIVRGEKNYLYDTEGRRYLDGVSSLWANLHGHCRPEINEAIRKQLDLVSHSTLLGLANAPSAILAKKMVEVTPQGLDRVFYSDCGATAVEIALSWPCSTGNSRGKLEGRNSPRLRGPITETPWGL